MSKNDKDERQETQDSKSYSKGRGHRSNRSKRRGYNNGQRKARDNAVAKNPKSDENSFNDITWYSRYRELLESSGRLAFPYKPGMAVPLGRVRNRSGSSVLVNNAKLTIPGIMEIDYDYTIGISKDVASPASMAAKGLWGRVRREFSGTMGFDAPDLFMFVLAVDQLHAYISYLKRIYRAIGVYDPNNRLIPETLFSAVLGGHGDLDRPDINFYPDYDTFVKEKVRFWNLINTLIAMSNTFLIPDAMDILHRHRWMNERVYTDAANLQSQMYVFAPQHFWFLNDVGETGTHLISQPAPFKSDLVVEGANPVDILYQYGVMMYSAIANWEEAYDINGRLQRVFEGAALFNSIPVMQDEALDFVPSMEVLSQIHNLTIVEGFEHADITQEPLTNAVIFNPTVKSLERDRAPIDLDTLAPSVEEVTIATRLTALETDEGDFVCGTEVVTAAYINIPSDGFVDIDVGWIPYESAIIQYSSGDQSVSMSAVNYLRLNSVAKAWFKAPMIGFVLQDMSQAAAIPAYYYLNADITNLTSVDYTFLEPLHRACISSEFNCFSINPYMGAGSKK